MTNQSHEYPGIDETLESQLTQTVGYLDNLLEQYGREPVEGEIGADRFTKRMVLDPKGKGYAPYYIHISEQPDGTREVKQAYNTYRLNPAAQQPADRATDTFYMWPLTPNSPDTKSEVTAMSEEAMRELIVKVSDAVQEGKVVPDKPTYPPHNFLARFGLVKPKPPKQPGRK